MYKNQQKDNKDKALLNTKELQEFLGTGRQSAIEFGTRAGAKVSLGRLLFWNKKAVEAYLDTLTMGA